MLGNEDFFLDYDDGNEITFEGLVPSGAQEGGPSNASNAILAGEKERTGSESDSSSSETSSERRRRKKEKKRAKKEKKREKKERKRELKRKASLLLSSYDEAQPSKRRVPENGSVSLNSPPSVSLYHHRRNPWGLLKPHQLQYSNTHFVDNPEGDASYSELTESNRHEVPTYTRLPILFEPNWDKPLPPEDTPQTSKPKPPSRYFSRGMATGAIENKFRATADNQRDVEVISIPNFPYYEIETPFAILMPNVEETSSAVDRQAVLANWVTNENRNDIGNWLKLLETQKEISATMPTVEARKFLFQRGENAHRATEVNPHSVELHIERLKCMQEIHGINSEAVSKMRSDLLNQFSSSIKLWSHCIASRQNDWSAFSLSGTLGEMDRCMNTLRSFLRGENVNLQVDPQVTEEFLVELIVRRCQLLIESGNTYKAVAALQALAEFHLFQPADLPSGASIAEKEKAALAEFEKYWNSMAPKIGDVGARGWKNSCLPPDGGISSSAETSLSQVLSAKLDTEEATFKPQCSQFRCSGEVWKHYDRLAAAHEWWPLRFGEGKGGKDSWREVHMHGNPVENDGGVAPVLFFFSRRELPEELVLRLLQLLGATIPALAEDKDPLQERLAKQLHPAVLSFMPQYEEMGPFLCRFISLLFHAEGVNIPRLLAACVQTYFAFSYGQFHQAGSLKDRMKHLFALESLVPSSRTIYSAVICYFAMEMTERDAYAIDSKAEVLRIMKKVAKCMLANQKSIWEMDAGTRMVYLRSYQLICEQVLRCSGGGPKPPKREGWVELTARQILQRLILSGNVKKGVDSTTEATQARERWEQILTGEGLPDQLAGLSVEDTPDMGWFGSPPATLLALAALFFYEESGHDEEVFNQAILSSPLGRNYGQDRSIYWLRIRLYQQHNQRVRREKEVRKISQLSYRGVIWEAIEKYPIDSLLWKRYIDAESSASKLRIQLDSLEKQIVEKPAARLARDCARIYVEWKEHLATQGNNQSPKWNRIHAAVEKARTNASGSPFPDAYFLCLLLAIERMMGREDQVEKTFLQAQKHCPWSIGLVREAAAVASCHDPHFLMNADESVKRAELRVHRQLVDAEILFGE